jgi:hypothetical protein
MTAADFEIKDEGDFVFVFPVTERAKGAADAWIKLGVLRFQPGIVDPARGRMYAGLDIMEAVENLNYTWTWA